MLLPVYYYPLYASLVIVLLRVIEYYRTVFRLRKIPTVGSTSIFSYYSNALEYRWRAREILKEGYAKYRGSAFKVADLNGWMVVVSGSMIQDIIRASEDDLSFQDAIEEAGTVQLKYISRMNEYNRKRYHVDIIRGVLTRNIVAQFADIRDEVVSALEDEIPTTRDWIKVNATQTMRRIVSRATNRVFVGLPLCRNSEYRDLNITFTIDVVKTSRFIYNFPPFLRPLAVKYLSNVPKEINKGVRLLAPLIESRLKQDEKLGKYWEGRPNDLISWQLDEGPPEDRDVFSQVIAILTTNFGAIHTTSIAAINALYYLAAYPEYIESLREEIESVVNEMGWSKPAMDEMHKLDSFMKEVQRHSGGSRGLSMPRKVVKDFTFSNGVTIPAGTLIIVPAYTIHSDNDIYPDAHEFKPFRFSERVKGESIKQQMVTPTPDYLVFGGGKHACPGRFLAVNVVKVILAHIILTYDLKFEDDQKGPPPSTWNYDFIAPDPTKKVLLRVRK